MHYVCTGHNLLLQYTRYIITSQEVCYYIPVKNYNTDKSIEGGIVLQIVMLLLNKIVTVHE